MVWARHRWSIRGWLDGVSLPDWTSTPLLYHLFYVWMGNDPNSFCVWMKIDLHPVVQYILWMQRMLVTFNNYGLLVIGSNPGAPTPQLFLVIKGLFLWSSLISNISFCYICAYTKYLQLYLPFTDTVIKNVRSPPYPRKKTQKVRDH